MGKLSNEDKMHIQTLCKQGFGAKAIRTSYPDNKTLELDNVADDWPFFYGIVLGRLLRVRVDLIKWVSNVRPPVRTSVRPQKVSLISMKFGM